MLPSQIYELLALAVPESLLKRKGTTGVKVDRGDAVLVKNEVQGYAQLVREFHNEG